MASFWIIAVAVLLNTTNKLYTKFLLHKVDSFSMLLLVDLIAGILAIPFAIYYRADILSMTTWQLFFTLLTAAIWSINGYLGNLSTEKAEVSIREPLAQMQVIWAVLIGVVIFGESLNLQQITGILFILSASLVLVIKKNIFTVHWEKETTLLILVYTLVTAIVASMDKYIMSFLRPEAYTIFNFIVPIIFLLPFVKSNQKNIKQALNYKSHLVALTCIFFVTFLSTLYVYKNFDFAISYPLLKIATPLTAIFGILIFNEKNMLGRKVLAIMLATLGAILVKVSF
jgi:drug/metabolite transporter (DMT)-like permease